MTTTVLQPASADTYGDSQNATTNYSTSLQIDIGTGGSGLVNAPLVKFNFSSIPTPAMPQTGSALMLYLYQNNATGSADFQIYKILQNWVNAEATYNIWKTSNDWTTAGCNGNGNDYDNTALATAVTIASGEGSGWKTWTLNASGLAVVRGWINGSIANYGFVMHHSAANSEHSVRSSDYAADTTLRPKFNLVYTMPGGRITIY